MEESLTIPRPDFRATLSRSSAVAGVGSSACIGPSQKILRTSYEEGQAGTGSNVTWLKSALPEWDRSNAADLFTLSLQRLDGVSCPIEHADPLATDRDALLYIKDTLSLTGQQLANAIGVSRAALYQWLNGSTEMRKKHRDRLDALRRPADFWSEKATGGVVNVQGLRGSARVELAQHLDAKNPGGMQRAQELLEKLLAAKMKPAPGHRSILDIAKERKWSRRPDYVRQAQVSSRIPSVGPNQEGL